MFLALSMNHNAVKALMTVQAMSGLALPAIVKVKVCLYLIVVQVVTVVVSLDNV